MRKKLTLNSATQREIDRELSKRSLAEFCRRAWHVLEPGTPLLWDWPLDAICLHLEAVTRGEIQHLLVNVPPGSMKSLLVGVFWPAWEWGPLNLQEHRFIGTAHEETLAIRDSRKCRDLIRSEWYQKRWSVRLKRDLDGKKEFGNTKNGVRSARAFTSMTGVRGDRVILDDPLSADAANSPAKLEAARLAFTETLPTRVNNPKTSAIVVIMQRLHEKDTSGIIKSMGLDYVHLRIPMRFEADDPCSTRIGWRDPRTKDGELMFPERFPEDKVQELEKTLGSYGTAGQLQQRPTPRGEGMFNKEWFEIVPAAPAGCRWVRGWDLAASITKKSPYTSGVLVGEAPDGTFYVKDARRVRGTPQTVENLITNTATQDGRDVMGSLPQDPGQAGKAQVLYLIKKLRGFNYRSSPESGDKVTRAMPVSAQAEAGNIKLIKGDWNDPFLDELAAFPLGEYSDQTDAASRAFAEFLNPRKSAGMLLAKRNR